MARLVVLHHLEHPFLGNASAPLRDAGLELDEGDPLRGDRPETVTTLHWNEDCYSLPDGAVELLSPTGPGVEAFRWRDSAWGIQFHPETDAAALDAWYADVAWLEEAGVDEQAA